MSTTAFIRSGLRRLHSDFDSSLADLSEEQLHWRANENGLPISFIAWHYVRTEDNIINFVLQGKPTVWLEGGWNERFGLPKAAQGTGMSHEEAQALRIAPREAWLEYQSAVWAATDAFLATVDDALLAERVTVKPLGEMAKENAIGMMCLTHGFTHLGEIQHVRGLLGLKGMAW
jgi:hypothetical protein